MYIGPDGKPTLILRYLSGNRRVKLAPITYEERGFIEPDENGKSVKFMKQRDEESVLVLGEPEKVAVMQHIFQEHWVNGVSIDKLTNYLNTQTNFLPHRSGRWNTHTVHRMLNNPVYLGEPIACRVSKGWFYKIGDERPVPVQLDEALLEARGVKNVPQTKRPSNEWFSPPARNDHPHPVLITDPEVRRLAKEGIAKFWKRWVNNRSADADRDRHKNSHFFLKKLLHSKQGNYPMVGKSSSKQQETVYRYYRINESECFTPKGALLRRQISAEPVEEAVLKVLRETFAASDELGSLVEKHVSKQSAPGLHEPRGKTELEAEEKKVARRIKLFYETAGDGDEDDAELRETINKLKARREELQHQLSLLDRSKTNGPMDAADVRNQIVSQLTEVSGKLKELPKTHLRRLVAALCQNMTVDLETRDFEFEMRLPSWAMQRANAIREAVGLESHQAQQMWNQTNRLFDLKIGYFRCNFQRENKKAPICYDCRRVPVSAAA